MALVEITSGSLHAGANLRKLGVGEVVEVSDETAQRWIDSGKAKETKEKKGSKLTAVDISAGTADTSLLQSQLSDALAQNQALKDQAEATEKAHADALAAETKRADDAEAALAEALKKDK
ncbi:hypothetical protein [Pantoea sp. A4]|uniref:hypothetical protein n=1 Tax=Pantoea sp. A4 TaxID=1225184 RepID=UPI00035C38D7|nr:hypothetical protein [Pantoea sp. A4]